MCARPDTPIGSMPDRLMAGGIVAVNLSGVILFLIAWSVGVSVPMDDTDKPRGIFLACVSRTDFEFYLLTRKPGNFVAICCQSFQFHRYGSICLSVSINRAGLRQSAFSNAGEIRAILLLPAR